ncbi:alpha/beta hydrolase [Nodosilinea sp. LEGE 06152]|uniref:alpha/beta fold hydrolase n=1 Tax=Nodosilinea sp. LEGE 06152 TaxID=2777966 RepID=UPI00187E86AE|nr:alpha/beta hydrolase [Nodosilinea sp. LEGE 06152]MBE9157738.1 alpha/beta hydrolase [Nodosilinea sp. LEGE 06152]
MSADVLRRNNVTVIGQGQQPLMLAHGFGCDQNMWRFITPAFEAEYRLVLFDYVGAGKSETEAYDLRRYSQLDGYAQDVLEICAALELEKIVFVGHSVSSMIGLLAAIAAPDYFERLIMIGPSPRYINDDGYIGGFERQDIDQLLDIMEKNYIGWAHFLAPLVMQNPDRPELGQELEESFCSTDPTMATRFAKTTFYGDNRSDLAKVTVPSLILQCAEDAIAPTEVGRYLHRHLPHSTLTLMAATGHCPHMSHPEETVQHIKTYLEAASLTSTYG